MINKRRLKIMDNFIKDLKDIRNAYELAEVNYISAITHKEKQDRDYYYNKIKELEKSFNKKINEYAIHQ